MCAVIERQRGSGALLMVIIILLMGTLLLNATRRQLSDSLSLVADQRLYLQQQAAAASALAWGGGACAGAGRRAGSASKSPRTPGAPACSACRLLSCCGLIAGRVRWRGIAGLQSVLATACAHCRTAGWISARWQRKEPVMLTNEQGFSLVETLFALLLFSLSFTALMHYQQALGLGFQQQWQQREAWRNAQQRLEGQQMPGWRFTLQARSGPSGCQLLSARATSPAGRSAELTQLQCPANRG